MALVTCHAFEFKSSGHCLICVAGVYCGNCGDNNHITDIPSQYLNTIASRSGQPAPQPHHGRSYLKKSVNDQNNSKLWSNSGIIPGSIIPGREWPHPTFHQPITATTQLGLTHSFSRKSFQTRLVRIKSIHLTFVYRNQTWLVIFNLLFCHRWRWLKFSCQDLM